MAGEEYELKFRLSPDTGRLLAEGLALGPPRRLDAVYFDTPSLALREAGWSLRLREEGGRLVQTAKAAALGAGVFGRTELEAVVSGPAPELTAPDFLPLARLIGEKPLAAAFRVRVERRKAVVTRDGARIEVACDVGEIEAAGRIEPLSELELELKAGAPAALFALAGELMTVAPLELAFDSKAERGYRLLGAEPPVPALEGLTAGQLLSLSVREGLAAVQENAATFLRSPEADALHRTRVALRRLRSLLAAFRPVAGDAQGEALRGALREVAAGLNAARDLDVMAETLAEALAGAEPEASAEPGTAALSRALEARRKAAYARAIGTLGSERRRRLALDLAAWAELGAWTQDPHRAELRDQLATTFAAAVLGRLRRKLKRAAVGLSGLDDEARHEARIRAKTLRYAADAFGPLFPDHDKRRRRFMRALKDLQEALGALNDQAVGRALALEVAADGGVEAAFAAGRLSARRERETAPLLRAAERACRALLAVKPFWEGAEGADAAATPAT